jgi:predicted nucleic acid-binding protein
MAFTVLVDACVLFPASLRDTLLRLAEAEMFDVLWSERILCEATNSMIADGRMTEEQAARLLDAINGAFDAACVPEESILPLEASMTNHKKDRHVLAAAVAGSAQAIITSNLKHFPADACNPFGIEALHPDEFLVSMHGLDPIAVAEAIHHQAAALKNPPHTVNDILEHLAVLVPNFARTLDASFASRRAGDRPGCSTRSARPTHAPSPKR